MDSPLSTSARKVQDALHARDIDAQVVELPASTRTAQDAAAAVGCTVAQIVKSLVFRTRPAGSPVLVLASGVNRVNEEMLGALLGADIEKADAAFVRAETGFVIGGVPPVGHIRPLPTIIDEDLLQFEALWAAAGTPNAVFKLSAADLRRLAAADDDTRVARVC
ncbi:MAG: YbaK/EbsC family protein [Caldilineaceae bacterium]|nr:YbaK/EbsC family protein [Caldilineaceae bacterium]